MGVLGSGPLSESSGLTALRTTRGVASVLPSTSLSDAMTLAPELPVTSDDGLTQVLAAQQSAPRRSVEKVFKPAPLVFEGAAPRQMAPPAAIHDSAVASQSTKGGTWAVVIGINDYPGSANDLGSAVNDAYDTVQALNALGVDGDHILTLRDGQVTDRTLLQAVSWLAAHAGPDSVAGFFYAGHVRKSIYGNEEIVTSDGSPVSDATLAAALSKVQASRSWVAIAACYGAGFDEVLRPGRVLTAAAGANSLAYENSAIGRSYMVEYMIRQGILQGRAAATVQTAFRYALDRISRDHPGREPVQLDNGDGHLDLRPFGGRATSQPSDPPPSQSPPTTEKPASDRPPSNGSQTCTGSGLFKICRN